MNFFACYKEMKQLFILNQCLWEMHTFKHSLSHGAEDSSSSELPKPLGRLYKVKYWPCKGMGIRSESPCLYLPLMTHAKQLTFFVLQFLHL